MGSIDYSDDDVKMGFPNFIKKLIGKGSIGQRGGYVFHSKCENKSITFPLEDLQVKWKTKTHEVLPLTNLRSGNQEEKLWEIYSGPYRQRSVYNKYNSSIPITADDLMAKLPYPDDEKKYTFPYSINVENDALLKNLSMNGYFDIRNENGDLKKYFKDRESVFGVDTVSVYYGPAGSMFPWHIEDEALWSLNFSLKGKKTWYFIDRKDTAELMRRLKWIKGSTCNLFGRSKKYYMDPSLIEQWGIKVHKVVQEAGDLVVTLPGGYHEGFNVTDSLNFAINFSDDKEWPPVVLDLPLVHSNCNESHKFTQFNPFEMLTSMGFSMDTISNYTHKGDTSVFQKGFDRVDVPYVPDQVQETAQMTAAPLMEHNGHQVVPLEASDLVPEIKRGKKEEERPLRCKIFEFHCKINGCNKMWKHLKSDHKLKFKAVVHMREHKQSVKCTKCKNKHINIDFALNNKQCATKD